MEPGQPKIGPVKVAAPENQAASAPPQRAEGKVVAAPLAKPPGFNNTPANVPPPVTHQITLYEPLPKGIVLISVIGIAAVIYAFTGFTQSTTSLVYKVNGVTMVVSLFLYVGLLLKNNFSRGLLILVGLMTIGLHLYLINQNRPFILSGLTKNNFYKNYALQQSAIVAGEVVVVFYLGRPAIRKVYS